MADSDNIVLKTVKVSSRRSFGDAAVEFWRYRHLCFHLASADLQSRFRRSALGIIWALIHPLAFTFLYSIVLATIFQQSFLDFSVYVFAGLILWEAISGFMILGSHSLINAAGYLKQSAIPMLLFPIRTSMTVTFIFVLGIVSFALYTVAVSVLYGFAPGVTIYWLWSLPICAALFLFGVPLATITAYLNVQFRDTQQILIIFTQAVWFASPVFFARNVFDTPELQLWATINPVVAFCDVFRDPLVYGRAPDPTDWIAIGIWVCIAWVVAFWVMASSGRKTVFNL